MPADGSPGTKPSVWQSPRANGMASGKNLAMQFSYSSRLRIIEQKRQGAPPKTEVSRLRLDHEATPPREARASPAEKL